MSLKTERAYLHRTREFIEFHGRRHPARLTGDDNGAYLTHLAVDRSVAASTQNVALNALVYVYRNVLGVEMPQAAGVVRAQRSKRIPCWNERPKHAERVKLLARVCKSSSTEYQEGDLG